MKRCAFLSTDDLTGFVTDDALAVPPLEQLGWQVDTLSWRAHADWDAYDVVVVRSTWDYQDHPAAFDAALERIAGSRALLLNPLPLMRWNMRKTYLQELQAAGVPLLPTVWGESPGVTRLASLCPELGAGEVVIKPVVGANADHAWRIPADAPDELLQRIAADYAGRAFLAQPFAASVVAEGEYSVIYVAGAVSHVILKTPKPGDFRVQEEHGGIITAVEPEPALLRAADAAMAALPDAPFYARVDLLRTVDAAAAGDSGASGFALMELELIEPALYFRMEDGAAPRFARALDRLPLPARR
jgi:hypothetical protein